MYYGGKRKENGIVLPGYNGKPYTIVSFVDDDSQGQVVLLKSKTKTFDEILSSIKNPYNLNVETSAKKLILKATTSEQSKRIHTFTDTLFSGNQVLDMLVGLAIDKPELFDKFFKNGYSVLEQTAKQITDKKFAKEYMSVFTDEFDKDLLNHITYSNKESEDRLRKVFDQIKTTVSDSIQSGKVFTKEDLKKKLLELIRGNKTWSTKFWNFFNFKNTIEEVLNKELATGDPILDDIKQNYEGFVETMNEMISYWKESTKDKVYHNVPIQTVEGISGGYKISDMSREWDIDNLYTSLTPEGMFLSLDLSKQFTGQVPPDATIERLKEVLKDIKSNGKTLLTSESNDNEQSLNDKISKAKKIKEVLEHSKNTTPFEDGYILNELKNNSITELSDIINILNLRGVQNPLNTLNNSIRDLETIITSDDDKSNRLTAFKYKLGLLNNINNSKNSSLFTDESEAILNTIVSKWNDKVFPSIEENNGLYSHNEAKKVSLSEYLSQLPETDFEIVSLFGDSDESLINEYLSAMIFDNLGINKDITVDMDITDKLFDDCSI